MIPAAPFPRTRNIKRLRAVQHHSLTAFGKLLVKPSSGKRRILGAVGRRRLLWGTEKEAETVRLTSQLCEQCLPIPTEVHKVPNLEPEDRPE